MGERNYEIYEGLRAGMLLTATSGFLDAFTYLSHGEHFASLQSGNLILLGAKLADGKFMQSLNYLVPIVFFMLGAGANFGIKKFCGSHHLRAVKLSATVEFFGFLISGILSFLIPSTLLLGLLAFFAAIQADTFSKLRGMPYATVMSTGNLKTFGGNLLGGIFTKDKATREKGRYAGIVVFTFFFGAFLSALCLEFFGPFTIFGPCILILVLNIMIFLEDKKPKAAEVN
jgi:uncharacterized membrane protein YoaK (UPF0700 family)